MKIVTTALLLDLTRTTEATASITDMTMEIMEGTEVVIIRKVTDITNRTAELME